MSDEEQSVENRSEIVLFYDARDTNPNGDPLAADNPPRVDRHTQQAIVTDVRLKRYVRDELFQQGHNILVKAPTQMYDDVNMGAPSRDALVEDIVAVGEDGATEFEAFLNVATDVRYFGATLSTDDVDAELPSSITGAVQFTHGRSLNPVSLNTESKRLSTVIASGEGKGQGTFATDNRLHYALIGFGGVVNENVAEQNNLTSDDVERLDTLLWDSITNQTTTRSKMGQTPRLYVRIEYEGSNQYLGGSVESGFEMESDMALEAVRNPGDYTVNATEFVKQLEQVTENIDTIHLRVNPQMEFTIRNKTYTGSELAEAFPVDVNNV